MLQYFRIQQGGRLFPFGGGA